MSAGTAWPRKHLCYDSMICNRWRDCVIEIEMTSGDILPLLSNVAPCSWPLVLAIGDKFPVTSPALAGAERCGARGGVTGRGGARPVLGPSPVLLLLSRVSAVPAVTSAPPAANMTRV